MIAFAKFVINDLSVKVLEYPEITIPEHGLKRKLTKLVMLPIINNTTSGKKLSFEL